MYGFLHVKVITNSGLNHPNSKINMFFHSLAPNVFNVLSDSVSTIIEGCIATVWCEQTSSEAP